MQSLLFAMLCDIWSLKFLIILSFFLFCAWLNFLLLVCLAEARQALGVGWKWISCSAMTSTSLGSLQVVATPWPACEGGGIIPSNLFPEGRRSSNPMGSCLGHLPFYSNRSTWVPVCPLLLSPGLWKLSRDHDERNMVSLACCIVRKWNNSKSMSF